MIVLYFRHFNLRTLNFACNMILCLFTFCLEARPAGNDILYLKKWSVLKSAPLQTRTSLIMLRFSYFQLYNLLLILCLGLYTYIFLHLYA